MRSTPATLLFSLIFFVPFQPGFSQSDRPVIIRDTDIAEGVEDEEAQKPKERNPGLAKENIEIGDFYFKKKNYDAAISRYLTAIEYQADSDRAYESLAKAYEKDGKLPEAMRAIKKFLDNNPDSSKCDDFRKKLENLEEKSSQDNR